MYILVTSIPAVPTKPKQNVIRIINATPSTWYVTNLRKIIADFINPESKCKKIMCWLMHMNY